VRADLTPLLVSAVYLFPGVGILAALGVVDRRPARAVAALGLAYLVGLSAVLIVGTWLLVLGIGVTAETMALLSAMLGGAGFAVAVLRRRHGFRDDAPTTSPGLAARLGADRWERFLVIGTALALMLVLIVGFLASHRLLMFEWDAWSIWARKARMLLEFGSLPTSFFADSSYAFMHPDYPLLVPLMEATWFRFAGFADTRGLHIQFWLLLVAFVWAAGWIVGRRARPIVWLPLLALIAVAPGVWGQLLTQYADIPMAFFLGLGLLLLGSWLESHARWELALAALLLAAAASTKNEGLVAAAAGLVAGLVVVLASSAGSWRNRARAAAPVLAAGAAVVASILPWRVWLAANDISGDMPIGKGLDPGFLASRAERVWPTIEALVTAMTDQGAWLFLLPLGIGVVVAGLLTSGYRRLSGFYGLASLLIFASLVWAYWISPSPLEWQLGTSSTRVIDGLLIAAAIATLHVASRGAGRAGEPPPVTGENGTADSPESSMRDPAGQVERRPATAAGHRSD
jgi:hypothetical protein